jgi:hypothetical protein
MMGTEIAIVDVAGLLGYLWLAAASGVFGPSGQVSHPRAAVQLADCLTAGVVAVLCGLSLFAAALLSAMVAPSAAAFVLEGRSWWVGLMCGAGVFAARTVGYGLPRLPPALGRSIVLLARRIEDVLHVVQSGVRGRRVSPRTRNGGAAAQV